MISEYAASLGKRLLENKSAYDWRPKAYESHLNMVRFTRSNRPMNVRRHDRVINKCLEKEVAEEGVAAACEFAAFKSL